MNYVDGNRIPRASGRGSCKRKLNMSGLESVDSWVSSEIERETFTFMWTLRNYRADFQNLDKPVESPCFIGGPISNHSWKLKIVPKVFIRPSEFCSVYLILDSFGDGDFSNTRNIKVRFQIKLIDADGKSKHQIEATELFKRHTQLGFAKFITLNELLEPSKRLLEDDTLKILVAVSIIGELKHLSSLDGLAKSDEEVQLRRFDHLSEFMKSMFESGYFSDVTVSADREIFHAHKSVLAARSSVFRAMFLSEMVESTENSVVIQDFDDDVVKAMLEYMYTGKALCLKAPDLMRIAEKYELMGLKEECEFYIAENLTVENAADVLLLSHYHSEMILKPKVIEFINRNKIEVCKTEAFMRLAKENVEVLIDVFRSQQ